MSEQTDEVTTEEQSDGEKNFRRVLEQKAADEKRRADELEKKLAFTQVKGLDMSNPAHQFFAENYKGDLDSEAISTKFTELGFGSLQQQQPAVQTNLESQVRMDALSANAQPADVVAAKDAAVATAMQADNEADFYAQLNAAGYLKR